MSTPNYVSGPMPPPSPPTQCVVCGFHPALFLVLLLCIRLSPFISDQKMPRLGLRLLLLLLTTDPSLQLPGHHPQDHSILGQSSPTSSAKPSAMKKAPGGSDPGPELLVFPPSSISKAPVFAAL